MAEAQAAKPHGKYKTDVGGVLSDSWKIVTENFGLLFLLVLTPFLAFMIVGIFFVIFLGIGFLGYAAANTEPGVAAGATAGILAALLVLAAFAISIISAGATTKALLQILRGQKAPTYSEAMKSGVDVFWSLVGVSVLVGLAVLGGLLLLIVPGIIFAIWFSLSVPVKLDDDKLSIVDSLKKSKKLVAGHEMLLVGIFLVYFLISFFTGFIPVVGEVAGFLVSLVSAVSVVYVYEALKHKKA